MSQSWTVGSSYRERREALGIPLNVAADATNIRARMLETLESSDFKNYPPHGHAVGMLSSYARYLGLEPKPLLELYEAEFAAFQSSEEMADSANRTRRGVGRYGETVYATSKPVSRDARARRQTVGSRRGTDEEINASRLSEKLSEEEVAEGDDRYKSGSVKVVGTRSADTFGHLRTESRRSTATRAGGADSRGPNASGRLAKEMSRTRSGAMSHADAYRQQRRAAISSRIPRIESDSSDKGNEDRLTQRHETSAHRSRSADGLRTERASDVRADRDGSDTPTFFGGAALGEDSSESATGVERRYRTNRQRPSVDESASKGVLGRLGDAVRSVFGEPRTRIIAIAFIVIVIGVIISAAVLISTAGHSSGIVDVQGGTEDSSIASQDQSTATTTVTTSNGNPVTVKISVAEGQASLVTVAYDDDTAYDGTAVGPWERSFVVTNSLSAYFGNPSAVTVTENDNEASIEELDDGTGVFNLEIKTTTTTSDSGSSDENAG